MLCFLMAGLGANDAFGGSLPLCSRNGTNLNGSQLSLIVDHQLCGKFAVFKHRREASGSVSQKECGCGGNGCLGGSSCPKSGVRQLYMDSGIHVFCSGSIHPFKYYGQYIDSGGVRRLCGLMVNVLFFIQGIGTSGSQLLLGRYAFHYAGWKWINAALLAVAFLVIVLFFFLKIPKQGEEKEQEKEIFKKEPDSKIFWIFIAMMGCYFNWGTRHHELADVLLYLCIFHGSLQRPLQACPCSGAA